MANVKTLVEEAGANGFIFADDGNGAGFGKEGQFMDWDQEQEDKYGDIEMSPLPAPHTSADGVECIYASDWVVSGNGDNPYRYRVLF